MKSKSKALVITTFLFLGFIATTIFSKCSSKTIEYKKTPPDTTQTFVHLITPIDIEWQNAGVQPDNPIDTKLFKIVKDTLLFDSTDANTLTKKWKRDSFYIAVIQRPIIDTVTKKQKTDSMGKALFREPLYLFLDKRFVLKDYNADPNFRK